MVRVLPREVAQAVMVPTTFVLRSLVRDVRKELPRDRPVLSMSFNGAPHTWAEKIYFGHKIHVDASRDFIFIFWVNDTTGCTLVI